MKTRRSVFDLLVTVFSALALLSMFVFMVLVPEGRAYRTLEKSVQKEDMELSKLQMQYDQRYDRHTTLQDEYRNAMTAIERHFDQEKFLAQHAEDVSALELTFKQSHHSNSVYVIKDFDVIARFDSPKNFYTFMEKINKSDWIMAVKVPMTFERVGDEINAIFSMNVYSLN